MPMMLTGTLSLRKLLEIMTTRYQKLSLSGKVGNVI